MPTAKKFYRISRFAEMAALGLTLSGCGSMTPAAMAKLSGLDPMSVEPGHLAVAAIMPVPLRLRTGDAVLKVKSDAPAPYGPIDLTLPLEIIAGESAPGVSANAATERVQIGRIAQADLEKLKSAQMRIKGYQASGKSGAKGSFTVGIQGGCKDGAIGEGPLIAAIAMRTAPGEDFFPMLKSVDLRKLAGEEALAKLPAC